MPKYPAPDDFFSKTSKHCVALFIQETGIGIVPKQNDLNATLTLIEYKGKIYGITCRHVVKLLEEKNSEERASYDFATLNNNKKLMLLNDFVFPPNTLVQKDGPDIAIRQIHPHFPKAIGKTPIQIENQSSPPPDIKHAIAVGFPNSEKKITSANCGCFIEMRCIQAIAEISQVTDEKIYLFSELKESPSVRNFSGMSGGPVFWTTEKDYGLLGIMREALPPEPSSLNPSDSSLGGGSRTCIIAESVTLDRFETWLSSNSHLTEEINWVENIKLKLGIVK